MKYDLRLKGFVGDWDFDADYTQYILDKFPERQVDVIIDSTGGELNTALSISAAFGLHGNVHVHFVGMNASAATIASLGAKKISMDENAFYLVHCCSAFIFEFDNLNAEQIDAKCKELMKLKENLQTFDISVAAAYAKRCKKSREELHALMEKEMWLTAQQALDWGFVDEVTSFDEDAAPVLDAVTACAFEKSGIPIPNIPVHNLDKSFAASLAEKIANIFNPKTINSDKMDPVTSHEAVKPDTEAPEVSAEAADETASNADILADNAENSASHAVFEEYKAQKEDEIKALKAELESLKKKPADAHAAVVDSSESNNKAGSKANDFFATARSASDLYKSLP